jgi:hypothetical protein
LGDVGLDSRERRRVVFRAREREEIRGVAQLAVQIGEDADEIVELLFLAAQLLGALGVGPDVGLFELPGYFGESRLLAFEVKDTSAARSSACAGPTERRRSG